jgi:putative transposase
MPLGRRHARGHHRIVRDSCDRVKIMTNHVHLVVDPGGNPESLSLLMKRVAGRQARYVNKLENRTGSLYKSSIVSSKEYLLACSRYIELNPVHAEMVEHPSQYQWSVMGKRLLEFQIG